MIQCCAREGCRLYQKRLFFAVALITAGVLARPLMAAPTVKKLGGVASSTFLDKDTQIRTPILSQRAPSLRLSGATTKSSTVTGGTKPASKSQNAAESARLPGLHGNILKGLGSKLSANNQSSSGGKDNSELLQRIIDLEADMATKQETLEPGDGIDINGATIRLTEDITNLPDRIDTISQDIDDLNEKIEAAGLDGEYYTKEQIDTGYYNKAYLDPILSQITNAKVAKDFDPSFLHPGQPPKVQP